MWTQAERRALRYIATGEYDKAISEYQKLLSEVGDDPDIYNAIGDLYIKKKDTQKAVEAYQKAIELYQRDNLAENAIAVARKALRYDESNKYLYLTLSELYAQVGRHDEALGYLSAFLDKGVEQEDVQRLQLVFKDIASSISKDMERQKRFERLFEKFRKIIEELGEMSLEEAQKSGGESIKFDKETGKFKKTDGEVVQFEQPAEEVPEPKQETPAELSEEELGKLAEWPSEEVEQKVWQESETPTQPVQTGGQAAEPWEYGGEGIELPQQEVELPQKEVVQEPFAEVSEGIEEVKPAAQKEPAVEFPELEETLEIGEQFGVEATPQQQAAAVQEPSEKSVSDELDAILNNLDEILEEDIGKPQEQPTATQERAEIGDIEMPFEELLVPPAEQTPIIKQTQTVQPEPTSQEQPIFQEPVTEPVEKLSPVEAFLRSTKEKEAKRKEAFLEEIRKVPSAGYSLLSILQDISAYLSSPSPLYYPNLDPAEFGRILMNMKLYDEAFRQFQKALLYMKPSDKASNILEITKFAGMALFYARKYRLAIKQFERALKLSSRDPELHYLVGVCYEHLGDYRKALEAYENAYLIDVDFRDVAERIKSLSLIERR